MPYNDGEFDAYYANFVLHLAPSASEFAREARRVVKQGALTRHIWSTGIQTNTMLLI